MKASTLELLGSIQRFLRWIRRDASLHERQDQDIAIEGAEALDDKIEDFLEKNLDKDC